MAGLRIYTDESVPTAVATGLRLRGADAWSARDAGHLGLTDEEQLEYACRERAVLFTQDDDFLRLAHDWDQRGRLHWGIIYVHDRKMTIGECIRRLMPYVQAAQADEMKNRIDFL